MVSDCKFCKQEFILKRKGHIFCTRKCREDQWKKDNPKRYAELQRKYRMKKPLLCHWCHDPIPNELRKSGLQFCSAQCRKLKRQQTDKVYRGKIFKLFLKYKEDLGCYFCGYSKCGACLDFHHTRNKKRRITAKMWYGNSEMIQKELKKCVLLCKNCHYKLHYEKFNGPISELDE